ncbi:MAG: RuvX/YqgF family protein [Candidatus Peregrinibacteria bacterium]|nr:RuvX/YqgF family protein [Candidatus Peregrinibacteria bacterium]MDZ4245093.1 RuvX/YqgF family protein [Candidatus Gracilibacteria bacterium]
MQRKLIGIDLGTTKTGLARSDESGTLAFTWQTIEGNLTSQLKTLTALILQEQSLKQNQGNDKPFQIIVFGLPSQAGEWKDKIQAFALELKHALQERKLDISLVFANEDFSSFDAQKNIREVKSTMKRKKRSQIDTQQDDAEAARIMLQGYLDKKT